MHRWPTHSPCGERQEMVRNGVRIASAGSFAGEHAGHSTLEPKEQHDRPQVFHRKCSAGASSAGCMPCSSSRLRSRSWPKALATLPHIASGRVSPLQFSPGAPGQGRHQSQVCACCGSGSVPNTARTSTISAAITNRTNPCAAGLCHFAGCADASVPGFSNASAMPGTASQDIPASIVPAVGGFAPRLQPSRH